MAGVNVTPPGVETAVNNPNFVIYLAKSAANIVVCSFFLLSSRWFTPRAISRKHLKIMAKKTDSTTNPAAPEKRAINPAAVAAKTKPAAKAVKVPATKAKRTTKAPAPRKPRDTRADVALRAYFIAEKRRAQGLHGDEHQDWLEAERQILVEGARPKKAKKV